MSVFFAIVTNGAFAQASRRSKMRSSVIWARNSVRHPRSRKTRRSTSSVRPCRPPSTETWARPHRVSLPVSSRPRCPVGSTSQQHESTSRQGGGLPQDGRMAFCCLPSQWSRQRVWGPRLMRRLSSTTPPKNTPRMLALTYPPLPLLAQMLVLEVA